MMEMSPPDAISVLVRWDETLQDVESISLADGATNGQSRPRKALPEQECESYTRCLMATIRISSLFFITLLQAWAVRPNILWITSEDNGPELGCYGDSYASTPNIDALAKRGLRYLNAWSNAPVCAPARTTLISGMFPPSTGSEHMRSRTRLPEGFRFYPQYLRAAGYYCTNNAKEDYNLAKPGEVWDESSRKAHWRSRAEGQPFFAIFNLVVSHESQIRKRPHEPVHDPGKVRLPAYHPDTPEVRRDWAQYYDKVSEMDAMLGDRLGEIEGAGLAEDTIVFYYGDHGSGMPRSKRWPYNSGLRVPLIVHVPEKFKQLAPPEYRENEESERLVSFADLPPTLMSLIGLRPPSHFHGHAFMGPYDAGWQPYIYGFRGRMDERYDLVRVVRDDRYIYIRHYMPHKIYGQYIRYMFQTPTTRAWREMHARGELNEVQSRFWEKKPSEELYDLSEDQDEVKNLAALPEHGATLRRLRRAQQQWAVAIGDLGFLPEGEIHGRAGEETPYEMGQDPSRYPLLRIMGAAELASSPGMEAVPTLIGMLEDTDSAVRYWAVLGLIMRGEEAVQQGREALVSMLGDASSYPRVTAAHALAKHGRAGDLEPAMAVLLESAHRDHLTVYDNLWALNAIDDLGEKVSPWLETIKALPVKLRRGYDRRMSAYGPNLMKAILMDFP